MKKILFGLMTIALSFAVVSPAWAASTMSVTGPSSATVGSQFTVSVPVNAGGDSINAIDAIIDFDINYVTVANVSNCASGWDTESSSSYSNTTGQISYTCSRAAGTAYSGTLLTITFNANAAGTAYIRTNTTGLVLRESDSTDIWDHSISTVNVAVSAAAGPTNTPVPGQATNTPTGGTQGLTTVGPRETMIISLVAAALLALGAVLVLRTKRVIK